MVSNSSFFNENKKAQALLKHEILRGYLAKFAGATASTSVGNRVGYLDGYAGPGHYTHVSTGKIHDGSPQIAMTIAADLLTAGRNLECIFVERDAALFSKLEATVTVATTPVTAIHGDVKDHLSAALTQFAGIPVLVFLDPFGTALDNELTVDAIMNRAGDAPTELLLNFSVDALRRIGGRLGEPVGAEGREKTLDRVDSWLGGDWWRDCFLQAGVGQGANSADISAHAVAREYTKRVNKNGNCASFAVPIRRNMRQKPLFLLTLFFPRFLAAYEYNQVVSLALKKWREALNAEDIDDAHVEDLRDPRVGWSRVQELQEAFKLEAIQFELDTVSTIKESIRSTLETQSTITVGKELVKVYGDALGSGRETHIRTAWKQLAAENVTCPAEGGKLPKAVIRRA